jgi:hypothetical protein
MRLRLLVCLMLAMALLACGGGQRLSILITSTPSEALVYVNDYPRGVTPVEIPYIFRGARRVQLRHEGYVDVDEIIRVRKPWYNLIPFMSLVLDSMPFPIPHQRAFHFDMVPEPVDEF